MYSVDDDPEGSGFPIRISPDQSLLTTPRSFSQPATSFIASRRQGIHQMPFSRLIEASTEHIAVACAENRHARGRDIHRHHDRHHARVKTIYIRVHEHDRNFRKGETAPRRYDRIRLSSSR